MAPRRPARRPTLTITTTAELGGFVAELRRSVKARQADLARRAGVGRQWIGALEQGKPTCEIGRVLRTLETLGLEIELKPYEPIPPWIVASMRAAERKAFEQRRRRSAGKQVRREIDRLDRLALNRPRVVVDLE